MFGSPVAIGHEPSRIARRGLPQGRARTGGLGTRADLNHNLQAKFKVKRFARLRSMRRWRCKAERSRRVSACSVRRCMLRVSQVAKSRAFLKV
ncbi:hypothetical protein C6Q04_12745 [Burkholderia multivorans]|nr:hypothetical protein EGY20_11450 [Burkholderia multivorans]PRF48358.1 hypothetical protein C6Q04_12745 [Burkholderia multivorans]PRG52602.1 hypothetical protein C6T63_13710 [Burkholderia multivorans]